MQLQEIRSLIRKVPNFPKPGIEFRDITPLLQNANAWNTTLEYMAEQIRALQPTKLIGIESRGFIFAGALSSKLNTAMAIIRKKGKLPFRIEAQTYDLEYGTDEIQMHIDAVDSNDRVVILDDVLASGGTAHAAIKLCQKLGAEVIAVQVLIELDALKGREKFKPISCFSIFNF